MNIRERVEVKDARAAGQADGTSQVDTPEMLAETPESGNSVLALFGLGLAGVAMVGWICGLAWIGWRLVHWLLF